jgi:hypothetical protein
MRIKMRVTLCGAVWAIGVMLSQAAYGAAICPTTIENDPPATADGCGILLTVGPSLNVAINLTGTGPYDGASSGTFGVINNSGVPLTSLSLSASGAGITLFAGNGIRGYVQANDVPILPPAPIVNGYEDYYGPQTTFANVDFLADSLIVNFTGSLKANDAMYFSLPGVPQSDYLGLTGPSGSVMAEPAVTPTPEVPVSLMMATGSLMIAFLNKPQKAHRRRVRT